MSKSTVSWPALPRAPEPSVETVLHGQIVLIRGLFTAKSCKTWQTFMDGLDFAAARPPKRGEAARSNSRASFEDADFARRLWEDTGMRDALADLPDFERASGLSANIRLYRYTTSQAFARHYDDSSRCPVTGHATRWTLLIYLTGEEDGVRGGETVLYEPAGRGKEIELIVRLSRGTAMLHLHGNDCLPHEGRPVLGGVKLVLRSDVTFD